MSFESRLAVLLSALPLVAAGFSALWWAQRRSRDASLVDVLWAVSLGLLALYYAVAGGGAAFRRAALGASVGLWSFRLAWHIYTRHRGGPEDGRYQALRARWGDRAQAFFFVFFQLQGLLAVGLSLPFLLVAFNPSPRADPLEVLGLALALLGVTGETFADRQLARHRADPAKRGKTCRSGLWRYSRHPNYFFEWLVWCAFALAALSAPYGAAGLASPAVMLALILWVTGIPPTEERALASRGDDYRRYQATTSAFVPWFPSKEPAR